MEKNWWLALNIKGQIKILEAVLSTILLVSVLIVASYLIVPTNPYVKHESENLEDFGYFILSRLTDYELLDDVLYLSNGSLNDNWEEELKVIISAYMPTNVYFNLMVYNASSSFSLINRKMVSNVDDPGFFERVLESVSTRAVYTTRRHHILVLILVLTRV